ncbi:unnamed protein product, partial [marine sediment metagenome]
IKAGASTQRWSTSGPGNIDRNFQAVRPQVELKLGG